MSTFWRWCMGVDGAAYATKAGAVVAFLLATVVSIVAIIHGGCCP